MYRDWGGGGGGGGGYYTVGNNAMYVRTIQGSQGIGDSDLEKFFKIIA